MTHKISVPEKDYELFLEVAKRFKWKVEKKELSKEKSRILEGIKEAVKELNLIKAGKLEGRDARELLNEL